MGSATGRRAGNRWEADDPYRGTMAQRTSRTPPEGLRPEGIAPSDLWRPPAMLTERLRPWIDIDAVGPEGFHAWLGTIVALLPSLEPPTRAGSEGRIASLARALADCASDRARAHFQASEYYRDNVALATRVKALEAIVHTSRRTIPSPSPAEAKSTERYLPRSGDP